MLNVLITRTVDFCIRHARAVNFLAIILGAGAAAYAAQHFAVNTDISKLIATDLPWRQRQLAFEQAFPERIESILAVVRAPTPELASAARNELLDELRLKSERLRSTRSTNLASMSSRNSEPTAYSREPYLKRMRAWVRKRRSRARVIAT